MAAPRASERGPQPEVVLSAALHFVKMFFDKMSEPCMEVEFYGYETVTSILRDRYRIGKKKSQRWASRILVEGEQQGYWTLIADPADFRRTVVSLAPKAERARPSHVPLHDRHDRRQPHPSILARPV